MQNGMDHEDGPSIGKPPPPLRLRVLVLLLASLLTFGSYYVYDTPTSLYAELHDRFADRQDPSAFDFMFNMLYSLYSFPNVLLPLIGGQLVDRVGVRVCIVVFSLLVVVGHVLTTLGVAQDSISAMLAGRFILGLGAESLAVSQSALISVWFQGKEMAFALGVALSVSRLGSVAADCLGPMIAHQFNVVVAFWVGVALSVMSVAVGLWAIEIDRIYHNGPRHRDSEAAGAEGDSLLSSLCSASSGKRRGFGLDFWVLTLCCFLSYGGILPFNNIAGAYLLEYYIPAVKAPIPDATGDCSHKPVPSEWRTYCTEADIARQTAGGLQSVPYVICSVLTPLIGLWVDAKGHRTSQILGGMVAMLATHTLFLTRDTSSLIPLTLLGVAYSVLVAVVWPCAPLIVQRDSDSNTDRTGTAFGILTAAQNLAMAIMPVMVAGLYRKWRSHVVCEYFFLAVSMAGVLSALWLLVEDERRGGLLRKLTMTVPPPRSPTNGLSPASYGGINDRDDGAVDASRPLFDVPEERGNGEQGRDDGGANGLSETVSIAWV